MKPLTGSEFQTALKNGSLPSVLLFTGEEEYFKQNAFQALRAACLPEGLESLNEVILEDAETDAIIAACETVPFMADHRLVIVRDHPSIAGRAEAEDKLIGYLSSVPPTTFLVFYCTGKVDERKKLPATVRKVGALVAFNRLKDQALTDWVIQAFEEHGRRCDRRAADLLVFTCGTDANLLSGEIQKIAAYHPEEPSVSAADIESLATPSTECTVFQMVDAVVDGKSARALTLAHNLRRNGESVVLLLSLLLRQYKLIQHVKILQLEKRSFPEIKSMLGVPDFVATQCIRQASGYTGGQVRDAVRICLDAEYGQKSGQLNEEGLLETVILKLLLLKNPKE